MNGASRGNAEDPGLTQEDIAARRIQNAFRGFRVCVLGELSEHDVKVI